MKMKLIALLKLRNKKNTGGQLANENGEEEDEEDVGDVGDDGDDKGDVDADLLAIMTRPKLKSSQGCSIAHEFWAAGQH